MSSDLCCGSRLPGWGLPGVCSQWYGQSSGVHPVLGEGEQHVWKVKTSGKSWHMKPSLWAQHGRQFCGGEFHRGARLSASRLFPCAICPGSQELGHQPPSSLASVQCSPRQWGRGTRECALSLSDVFRARENVIRFEQFAGSFVTHPPELGTEWSH